MEAQTTPLKTVPYLCPVCTAPNAVNLIALARSGTTTCVKCTRRLSSSDVARAMHSPRTVASKAPAGHVVSGQRRLGGTRPGLQ